MWVEGGAHLLSVRNPVALPGNWCVCFVFKNLFAWNLLEGTGWVGDFKLSLFLRLVVFSLCLQLGSSSSF